MLRAGEDSRRTKLAAQQNIRRVGPAGLVVPVGEVETQDRREVLKIGVWDKLKDLFLDELLTRMTDYLHEKKRLDALENAFDCLEREFEVTYEGTIVSDGAFYECIKNCHILYRLIEYVENNTGRKQPADVFLSNVLSGMSAMTAPVRSMRRCKET